MFIKIDDDTIINTDHITYYHQGTRIIKLTSGETFMVDPEYMDKVKMKFSQINHKETS